MNSREPGTGHGLTKENLVATLPVALQKDPSVVALSEAIAELLARRPAEIDRLRIYPAIDRLDGPLLDILAYDFKVDWWDPDYSLAEKRRVFKGSWYIHKHMGTRAAVETALRAIYPKATVEEWFEYGGEPYHFKLSIDLTGETSDAARPWRVLERVNFYKSLRSHMEETVFNTILPPAVLCVGGRGGTQSALGLPEDTAPPERSGVLYAGGALSGRTSLPVPEDTAAPPATTIMRTGGVCTILSNLSGRD